MILLSASIFLKLLRGVNLKVEIKYGKSKIKFDINEKNYLGTLLPNKVEIKNSEQEIIKKALLNPIGTLPLRDIVKKGEKVTVVTSDITRPMPSDKVLPFVVDEIKKGGVSEKDICIVLALGSHRCHTNDEKRKLVGDEIYDSDINVIDSDMEKCINLGMCNNGTPVDIFEPVVKSDRLVCLGNIEYHYFAGYSGGSKALMPGVSSHDAIQANHSNMVHENAYAGNIDSNPVRQDIDQTGEFIKIDFIFNVVLNDKKEVACAVAGDYISAHREGCRYLDNMYRIDLDEKADIVVVSPGGFPKDINLYQSQKGLDNSKHAVKDGGIIILCASAKEVFGEETFEEWMLNKTPDEMIKEIKENFKLGGHKAAAIAQILKKAKIFMVTDMNDELVRKINFEPFANIKDAVDAAIEEVGESAKVLFMPVAGSTLPSCKD